MSFVDSACAWGSWQTFAMVGAGLVILAAAVRVESRVAEPVVPRDIVKQRGTALAILASLAVGMAMFGGAVFLGQYFQIGRGRSPTEAALLTIPMMAGVPISSTVSERLSVWRWRWSARASVPAEAAPAASASTWPSCRTPCSTSSGRHTATRPATFF